MVEIFQMINYVKGVEQKVIDSKSDFAIIREFEKIKTDPIIKENAVDPMVFFVVGYVDEVFKFSDIFIFDNSCITHDQAIEFALNISEHSIDYEELKKVG